MMKKVFIFMLLCCSSVVAQQKFELKNASEFFDIKISVAGCEDGYCRGKASFSFYKKGGTTAYQTIDLPETLIELDESGEPNVNSTLLYETATATPGFRAVGKPAAKF